MTYILGARSRANLDGVHPKLVLVVESAITLTIQDFRVHEGLRSLSRQRLLVEAGMSWTLRSKHLRQADGFAHAVDLVPIVDGRLKWDWPGCRRIAAAMAQAAREHGVKLRWGGVWDKPLGAYGGTVPEIEIENAAYVARRKALGKRAAIDGPHFELVL